jgi:RimJ/RimL family protein N-acetyltransferase
MIHELKHDQFSKVLPLFNEPVGFPVTHAVIEGNNPGCVFVDDPDQPTSALIWAKTEQAFYLGGSPDNQPFNHALNTFIVDQIKPRALANHETNFQVHVLDSDWESAITSTILLGRDPIPSPKQRYRLDRNAFSAWQDWRKQLPAGFEVQPMQKSQFETVNDGDGTLFKKWWLSFSEFEKKGLATCIMHQGQAVSTCFACFVGNNSCEIGIVTLPEFRGRSLAAINAAAFIEVAFEKALTPHWTCTARNKASSAVALKLGFELVQEYPAYFFCYKPQTHQLAWAYHAASAEQDFFKASHAYSKAAEMGPLSAGHWYDFACFSARANLPDQALTNLEKAAELGWTQAQHTEDDPDLDAIKPLPGWTEIISKIKEHKNATPTINFQ